MMKLRHLFNAIIPCLLLGVAPLLSNCGEAAGFGTETGNPPQLQEKKLYLEVVAGGLRVVGAAGAVAPPGASVRVTNLTTGASVETTAAGDGSLDVVIVAEPGDELEVIVTSGGIEVSERLDFGAIGRRTELSGLSCPALEGTLNQTLAEVFAAADVACATDSDCTAQEFAGAAGCYNWCEIGYISTAGVADVVREGIDRTAAVCTELVGCDRGPMPLCLVPLYSMCVAGTCQGVDPNTLSCEDFQQLAEARRTQLSAVADKACVADSDCALANLSVSCIVECRVAVASVAGSPVALETAVRDEVESSFCAPFRALGCPLPNLDCPQYPVPEAFCNAGACDVRTTTP